MARMVCNQMLELLRRKFIEWRRRRNLAFIRRKFAESGHPLDEFDDLNIEVALTLGERRIEQVPLTAKSIFFALRRLAPEVNNSGVRRIERRN